MTKHLKTTALHAALAAFCAALAGAVAAEPKLFFVTGTQGVLKPAACTTPWGANLAHAASVQAFKAALAGPEGCQAEMRTCNNNVLTGSFAEPSCRELEACNTPWGTSISHGASVTAFEAAEALGDAACVSQTRSCADGALSGEFLHASCTVRQSCATPWGASLVHGASVTAYLKSAANAVEGCQPQTRSCVDGALSGSYMQQSCEVMDSCSTPWGSALLHGETTTAYKTSSAGAEGCVSETRACSDGALSGSFAHQSCKAVANCTAPWGDTVAHGASVTAYANPNGNASECGAKETRTCNDGALSGSYGHKSCAFAYIQATGGTIYTPGNGYRYHVFASAGNHVFTVTSNELNRGLEVLLVGGGGAGGRSWWNSTSFTNGGGGGGGGVVFSELGNITARPYYITVGAGGSAAMVQGGASGIYTYSDYSGALLSAGGGGRGGGLAGTASSGLIGGGGGGGHLPSIGPTSRVGGAGGGYYNEGGGAVAKTTVPRAAAAGGGGGSGWFCPGEAGVVSGTASAPIATGGAGGCGDEVPSDWRVGAVPANVGGGGAACRSSGSNSYGGGAGGTPGSFAGKAGQANTGGGGGGGCQNGSTAPENPGGNGGSGLVVIRYLYN